MHQCDVQCVVLKNSWKSSLKAKMKRQRCPLVSDTMVLAMKQKYGRPDVSGRKRKAASSTEQHTVNEKMPRFKVIPTDCFNAYACRPGCLSLSTGGNKCE